MVYANPFMENKSKRNDMKTFNIKVRGYKDNKYGIVETTAKEVTITTKCGLSFQAIYSPARIAEIPQGYIKRSIRGDDETWEDATIEQRVLVNHNADILIPIKYKDVITDFMEIEQIN